MAEYVIYHVVLPYLSLDEIRIGFLYNLCQSALDETGGGEGVEVVVSEEDTFKSGEKGHFYHKILHLASKVPSFIRLLAPKGSLEIHAKTEDTFPGKFKTEFSNPDYMKENFRFIRHTIFKENDKASMDKDVFDVDEEQKEKALIVDIDIVNDPVSAQDYSEATDPTKVRFEKINCGPLTPDWKDKETKFLTVYMFEEIEFKWWGLQTKVQSVLKRAMVRAHLNFYRKLICSLDKWYGMTIDGIRELEEKTKKELEVARTTGDVRGMVEK